MSVATRSPAPAERLSVRLESAAPVVVLAVTAMAFEPGRLAVVSAFGPGTMVLLDMLAEHGIRLPVVFVDTLHHFPETLEHVERVRARYDLDLRIVQPAADRASFEARHGPKLWERDLERYQRLTKVEPFRRATAGLDAYITGRRRDQAETRASLPVIERPADGVDGEPIRVNPLASWTHDRVWDYLRRRDVPVNPLHHRGYASIGDAPLTTPVAPGEHERAGRWRGTDVEECGIHMFGSRGTGRIRRDPVPPASRGVEPRLTGEAP